ncbi:MAG: hypothetical protein LBE59_07860 [Nevskiaceae bacterium]|jgi:hypothetical protein|nr:hypothetical protein [Nevskiaceae bacterium]
MGEVFQFTSRADLDAKGNLAEFIRQCRDELTAFGERNAWDNDRWSEGKTVVVFGSKTPELGTYSFTPMADPFKQFAKAYIRYHYSHRPVKSLAPMLQALRCVEAGLLCARGAAEVGLLNGAVMDVCAEKCREFYGSGDVRCNTGRHIESVFDFIRKERFISGLPLWKSPFRKPSILTEDIGAEGREYRQSKLPSNETMLLVADLFALANDAESRFFSSILMLLMATPSRISEVLALPADCIQWEQDEEGVPQMYLRWRAAKGKGAMKKWVIPAMHDVVQEAVRRLVEIGEPARAAAHFAFNHPGRFMSHPDCLADPERDGERPLMPDEFCVAVGVKCVRDWRRLDGSVSWSQVVVEKRLMLLVRYGKTSYRNLAEYVLATYGGSFWPYIDEVRTVEAWNALCLHRVNEFHKEHQVKYFSWWRPSQGEVHSRITPEYGRSIFERLKLRNADGSSVRITTHQLRHWLSTMSERAGMDDYTLAQWAGRASVRDNRHYDHRSPEERLEAVKEIMQIERPTLLERFRNRQPVTYLELGADRLGTAKATLYGMCVHDYAMAPCQKQRECMSCKEHVCIKGDHVTLDRIRVLEAQTEDLLQRARMAHEDGIFGGDRWIDNHKWKLAHVRAMRVALEQSHVPDGTVLRIPDGHDPSPVRRALMDLGVVKNEAIEATGPQRVRLTSKLEDA